MTTPTLTFTPAPGIRAHFIMRFLIVPQVRNGSGRQRIFRTARLSAQNHPIPGKKLARLASHWLPGFIASVYALVSFVEVEL
jgi:hypothetical protein